METFSEWLLMKEEKERFLSHLRNSPLDHTTRSVYADYLYDQGKDADSDRQRQLVSLYDRLLDRITTLAQTDDGGFITSQEAGLTPDEMETVISWMLKDNDDLQYVLFFDKDSGTLRVGSYGDI